MLSPPSLESQGPELENFPSGSNFEASKIAPTPLSRPQSTQEENGPTGPQRSQEQGTPQGKSGEWLEALAQVPMLALPLLPQFSSCPMGRLKTANIIRAFSVCICLISPSITMIPIERWEPYDPERSNMWPKVTQKARELRYGFRLSSSGGTPYSLSQSHPKGAT